MNSLPDNNSTRTPDFAGITIAGIALFTIAWAVTRACLQSITLDEADTYAAFVAPLHANHWTGHSNNHVLNSLLMRLTTTVFGLSQLTVRLPALLGACFYLASAAFLCRTLITQPVTRVLAFVCLTWNPYLGDFYLAARGYSLAVGFLTCAIAVLSTQRDIRHWMAASVLFALSFSSNFPFAFINATTWAAFFIWTLAAKPQERIWRLLAASIVPGFLVVWILPGWTLLHWPSGELWDGYKSVSEAVTAILSAALWTPNPEVANPLLLKAAEIARPYLVPVITLIAALFLVLRRRSHQIPFALAISAALLGSLLIHYIAFRVFGLLLPRTRMLIYAVPMWTLAVIAVAAIPSTGRTVLVGALSTLALYYTLCLRSNYFFDWWACADAKEVYYVLAYYNHTHQITDVAAQSPMTSALEFYRRVSGAETFSEFHDARPVPGGKSIYAFYESQNRELIERENLRIIYRGHVDSDVVVAIQPDAETRDLRSKGGHGGLPRKVYAGRGAQAVEY